VDLKLGVIPRVSGAIPIGDVRDEPLDALVTQHLGDEPLDVSRRAALPLLQAGAGSDDLKPDFHERAVYE
jgi:hypothetical protein